MEKELWLEIQNAAINVFANKRILVAGMAGSAGKDVPAHAGSDCELADH